MSNLLQSIRITTLLLLSVWFSSTLFTLPAAAAAAGGIAWKPWSDEVFAQAKREQRYVLLDLGAVWCHWCHVMEEKTYSDPKVIAAIRKNYIAVQVDQDARPDLSRRYEEYGWPATIIFDASGREIVKRRGYIPAERMTSLLQAVVDDPSPIKYADQGSVSAFSESPLLAETTRAELKKNVVSSHDFKLGGLDQGQKFMDRDTVEYALWLARKGDAQALNIARQDLDGALNLIDPVWGGVYQYSTHGDWRHPHFEKLLSIQAEYMRLYSLAYLSLGEARYLKAATDIYRYVQTFLTSPEGAYYVSQDADLVKGQHSEEYFALDDSGRRKLGIPTVDKHRYARESGWMIQSLALLHAATGDEQYLKAANAAARWAMTQRALAGGGFRHDEKDVAGPYLEDTLAMARGCLALYSVTAERTLLACAQQAAGFMRKNFASQGAGFLTAADRGQTLKPRPQIDENIAAARFYNLLAHYTGQAEYRKDAERAMRYLVTKSVALSRMTEAGILLADVEFASAPVHLTIVGAKTDSAARALFNSALRYPAGYRRIEWWDRREGALPNPDVRYPELPKAAAFVCTQGSCSLPQFKPAELLTLAQRLDR